MAAFELGTLFYQPHHNHRALDRGGLWEDYVEARRCLDGRSVSRQVEWAAFGYALGFAGLSYVPPVAGALKRLGALQGWWGHTLEAIVENLSWCARVMPA
jgi:hypothetical protein